MPRTRRQKINSGHAMRVECRPIDLIRFLSKVTETAGRLRTPCWFWTGHTDANGYGQVKLAGRAFWAHRVAYAVFVRSISAGREVDHRCNNPSCVNPRHLRSRCPIANATDGGRFRHDNGDDIPI